MAHQQPAHRGVPGGEGSRRQHLGVDNGRPHQCRRPLRLDELQKPLHPRRQLLLLRGRARTSLAHADPPGARHADLLQPDPAAGRQRAGNVSVQHSQQRARRGHHRTSPPHQIRHPADQAAPGAPQPGNGVQARIARGGLGQGARGHVLAQDLGGDDRALNAPGGNGPSDRSLGAGLPPPAPQGLVPAQLAAGLTHRRLRPQLARSLQSFAPRAHCGTPRPTPTTGASPLGLDVSEPGGTHMSHHRPAQTEHTP